jgi:AraC-like DNA-binding protein
MPHKQKQRIEVSDDCWWFHDPGRNLVIKLDPLFAKCGWSVSRLCGMLCVGKRTFARVVEESIGITGKLWLRRLRIVKARHLLREGGEIKSVAEQLGFDDNASFANEFKKLIGVSPSSYIKSEQSRSFQFQCMNQAE